MAAKATPVVSAGSSAVLLAAALNSRKGVTTTDRIAEVVSDATGSFVRGSTEILSRSFGGVGNVWAAGSAAGQMDGVAYADKMLQRCAARHGWTNEEAASILAAANA